MTADGLLTMIVVCMNEEIGIAENDTTMIQKWEMF